MHPPSQSPEARRLAARRRDATFARIGRARRWLIAGVAVLTAGFAALVSTIAPHKAVARVRRGLTPSRTAGPATAAAPRLPPLASAGALGLSAPAAAPTAPVPVQPQPSPSAPSPSASAPAPSGSASAAAPAPVTPAPAATSGGS